MSNRNVDFFKNKKEWSITKDDILAKYLVPYFQKIFALKKPICYIDCFAGKGKFEDGSYGSPLIATEKLKNAINQSFYKPEVSAYFIELNYYKELSANLSECFDINFRYRIISGKFEDNIDVILKNHANDTVFLYIDPYGIKALDVNKFNSFRTHKNKSVELLINFNTWGFLREACRVLKADFVLDEEINEYLVEYNPSNDVNREELCIIAGGDFWIDIVLDFKKRLITAKEAEEKIAYGIAESFRKAYKYVLNVPIKSNNDKSATKYRLFHLTNHSGGCLIMADNMFKRFNEAYERQRDGQMSLFDYSTSGDLNDPRIIKEKILGLISYKETRLTDLLCDFYCTNGIITDQKTLKLMLKDLESEEKIVIKRVPPLTKTGKISCAMDENGSMKIYVRKRIIMKTINRKTLLYKTGVEYGDYTINHIMGCAHGCLFPCYAFNMAKRFGNVRTYEEWIEPKLVGNALDILDEEIPRYKKDIKSVQLCFTTDPFMMGYDEVSEMSIEIIKRLNRDDIKVTTLTKGLIPDDALDTVKYNEYGITLVSLDESFRKQYEPHTSNYKDRIASLKKMHDAGFKTWVSIEPYPTPNIIGQDLVELLSSVDFVDYIVFGRWHYNKIVSAYKNNKIFYNECAEIVKTFCDNKSIKCHIKNGTITE